MTDYSLPGKTNLDIEGSREDLLPKLDKPVNIPGTNIELVRPYDGRGIIKVLFDFDGTLSRERDGWPNLMVACNSSALVQAIDDISPKEAIEWVIKDIETTIGIPTYIQMERLASEIERRGGKSKDPAIYKEVYNNSLVAMVKEVHKKLEAGELSSSDLQVTGSIELLSALQERLGNKDSLYLASGTDIEPVVGSVKLLGFDDFFTEERIEAARATNPRQCAKELVVNQLIDKQNLQKGQLGCFGDGSPEILHTYLAGGVCVGVLTPDHSYYEREGHFTVEQKRERLIDAGAHILVPDFSCASALVEVMFSYYKG